MVIHHVDESVGLLSVAGTPVIAGAWALAVLVVEPPGAEVVVVVVTEVGSGGGGGDG